MRSPSRSQFARRTASGRSGRASAGKGGGACRSRERPGEPPVEHRRQPRVAEPIGPAPEEPPTPLGRLRAARRPATRRAGRTAGGPGTTPRPARRTARATRPAVPRSRRPAAASPLGPVRHREPPRHPVGVELTFQPARDRPRPPRPIQAATAFSSAAKRRLRRRPDASAETLSDHPGLDSVQVASSSCTKSRRICTIFSQEQTANPHVRSRPHGNLTAPQRRVAEPISRT